MGYKPMPVWGFKSKIHVLHHPTTIKSGYQPVCHIGNIRQTATIVDIEGKEYLRAGDVAIVTFQFINNSEYVHIGRPMIIREGMTKMIGTILCPETKLGKPQRKRHGK